MEQPLTAQDTSTWYLIVGDGDLVMRVDAGMLLGETVTGDLSFATVDAQLKLDIDDDGDLVVSEVDGSDRQSYKRLEHGSRIEISLPHNVLQFDSDFTAKAPADERIQVRARPASPSSSDPASSSPQKGPTRTQDAPTTSTRVPPADPAPVPATNDSPSIHPNYAIQLSRALLRQQSLEPEPVDASSGVRQQSPEREPVDVRSVVRQQSPEPAPFDAHSPDRRRRARRAHLLRLISLPEGLFILVPLIALGVVGFLLIERITREANPPIASTNIDSGYGPQPQPAEIVVSNEEPISPELSTPDSVRVATAPPRIDNTPTLSELDTNPELGTLAQQTLGPLEDPIPEPKGTPTIDPIPEPKGTLPLKLPSIPQVAQKREPANPLSEPLITARQPDGRVEPEPGVIAISLPDRAAELTLERDLLAAELALEEGRLMTPEQTSAFTLFSRVLSMDSNSAAAKKGLSSVREALINRTFAQLASASWDDALGTLQGAVDAGANPSLVADLRGEVDFGRRLANAQVGRFDELYPFESLAAISQKPPRLRRYRSSSDGPVDVRFTVSARGEVLDIEILGNPPRGLEQAVRRAVGDWRFEPVFYNGRPLPVRTSVRIPIRN